MMEFLKNLDFSPLWISLKTGVVATIFSFFLGIYFAYKVMGCKGRAKSVLDGILTLPLVLPPTVAGFLLLRLFSVRRPFGFLLQEHLGIQVVQTWLGCVVAAVVISLPLMYKNARAAFEQVDKTYLYAAQTLGISQKKIFWKILIPLARPGLLSGATLTFARALGEYGATAMLAGNIPRKTATISQKIAMVMQDGDYQTAGFWVGVIGVLALILVIGMNLWMEERSESYEAGSRN